VRRLAGFAAGQFPAGPKLHERMERFAAAVVEDRPETLYRAFISKFHDPAGLLVNAEEPPTVFSNANAIPGSVSFVEMMMFLDAAQYLVDDILVKLDRATMAVGLEARCPLLDHRVVELAWRMPQAMKLKGVVGKLILRKLAAKHFPEEWFNRPKSGFVAPIAEWLRGPLRPWGEDLLSADRLRARGLLEPDAARRLWDEHQRGARDRSPQLWTILMLESWQESCARAAA
jgi:asparagine synthase (glutamine-hydrolysing)